MSKPTEIWRRPTIPLELLKSHSFWHDEEEEVDEVEEEDIVRFYQGELVTKAKRKIDTIWNWSDDRLEREHDFIQWLFPTKTKSRFNRNAPVLTDTTIAMMKSDENIMANVRTSLDVMMEFYGWKINETEDSVERLNKPMVWIRRTHNYDRITRILTSLILLDLHRLSELFFLAMCKTIKLVKDKQLIHSFTKYWLPTQRHWLPLNIIRKYNISMMRID